MKMFELIPAIDLLDGKAVRLTKGDYNQVKIYSDHPEEIAKQFANLGVKRIHLVDLDGARAGQPVNLATIKKIRQSVDCRLELGGGLRTRENILEIFNLGINYAIIGSIALKNKALTQELVTEFKDKIIVGIDAKNGLVATEGWLENSSQKAEDLLREMEKIGVSSVIYTDISRDGTLTGPNFTDYEKLATLTKVKIIASGGISGKNDILKLGQINGLAGTIIGKAIYEQKLDLKELLNG